MRAQLNPTIHLPPAGQHGSNVRDVSHEVGIMHGSETVRLSFRFVPTGMGSDHAAKRQRIWMTIGEARQLAESLLKMSDLAEKDALPAVPRRVTE